MNFFKSSSIIIGYSLALCTLPIKVFKLLGVEMIIITNAAGGINQTFKVGDLMVIKDHMSFPLLSLSHPLIGNFIQYMPDI